MRFLVACCCLLSLACGGDTKQPVDVPVSRVGTYSLRTVDGLTLPISISGGFVLTGESLVLNADSTFTTHTDQQYSDASGTHTTTLSSAGTYSVSDLRLTLYFANATALALNFTGDDEVTGHCCSRTWVYRR
ncbi:MAG TPA: hypothetical protein VJ840_16140 [Gemmatimonadaceae bacterium]|nr:hypothetical protein [Gemmatimonadaceae bacterium]